MSLSNPSPAAPIGDVGKSNSKLKSTRKPEQKKTGPAKEKAVSETNVPQDKKEKSHVLISDQNIPIPKPSLIKKKSHHHHHCVPIDSEYVNPIALLKLGLHNGTENERRPVKLWDTVCKEVEDELSELNEVLEQYELPAYNDSEDQKKFDVVEYSLINNYPDMETCLAKDYVDFYILPTVLEGIRSLLAYVGAHDILSSHYSDFSPMDYLAEYLYNKNPFHPERAKEPVRLMEIPFAVKWLEKYPRKPLPKWFTMSDEKAALIIQCWVRGWLVRKREDLQPLRAWLKERHAIFEPEGPSTTELTPISPYKYPSAEAEGGEGGRRLHGKSKLLGGPLFAHSDNCFICGRFRDFLQRQYSLFNSDSSGKISVNGKTSKFKSVASRGKSKPSAQIQTGTSEFEDEEEEAEDGLEYGGE